MLAFFARPLVKALLPWAGGLIAVLAVLVGVAWIDHRGYQRAVQDRDVADLKMRVAIQHDLDRFEKRAIDREADRDRALNEKLAQNATATDASKTIIQRELTHEIRYTDPGAGIPDRVRAEIDRSLARVACARTDGGGIKCTLPDAAAAGDQ